MSDEGHEEVVDDLDGLCEGSSERIVKGFWILSLRSSFINSGLGFRISVAGSGLALVSSS